MNTKEMPDVLVTWKTKDRSRNRSKCTNGVSRSKWVLQLCILTTIKFDGECNNDASIYCSDMWCDYMVNLASGSDGVTST